MSQLVSILIPCYNAAPWLAQTLQSALGQTWQNKEIIVVDDGSTDESITVARRFADRGVRLITQENRGASAARNRALRESRGDFFQFLDADDLISPDKISAQIAILADRLDGTLASCAWGRFTRDPSQANFVDVAAFHDLASIDFLIEAARTGLMMHPSAWLVPRGVAEHAGPWDESLSLNDDGEYFCRVLLASSGVAFAAGASSYYRSGLPGALSQRRDERSRRSQFHSIELIARHLLAVEDSARIRQACANYYQRFLHDFYPWPRNLMREAERRVREFGGSDLKPPMGAKSSRLASLLGWKAVRQLKHLLHR